MRWRRGSGKLTATSSPARAASEFAPIEFSEIVTAPRDTSRPVAPSYSQWPAPRMRAPMPVAVNGKLLTCVRLNCAGQGQPTDRTRCSLCEHPTQLLSTFRWPRP